jgi:hypothetical protein
MRSRSLVLLAVLLLIVGPVAVAKNTNKGNGVGAGGVPPGQPFQALQAQIDALKAQVMDLQDLLNANLLSDHHQELSFTISPGDSVSFPMPKAYSPVRVEVTFSLQNAGVQTPSEVLYAVVNLDALAGEMTWVGTNSDGTMQASNTLDSPDEPIASICGGAPCSTTINASLVADPTVDANNPYGSLVLAQSGVTTSRAGHYEVHLWY